MTESTEGRELKSQKQGDLEVAGEMGSAIHFHGFDVEKKKFFIETALKYWPNLTKICSFVGITTSSYYRHIKLHQDFASLMASIDQAITDEIEQTMRSEAVKPKSFLDRMAYLRAHRPELYDRAKVVRVEGLAVPYGEAQGRARLAETAIDADIVGNYKRRKEKQLGAGEGAKKGGEAEGGGQP